MMIKKLALAILVLSSLTVGLKVNAQQNHPIYQKAKKELPEPAYTMYRVVERIARANLIDEIPWRIAYTDEYDVNAHAGDINLIVMNIGLYDRVIGDPSALACVIGLEMAHHTELHIPQSLL